MKLNLSGAACLCFVLCSGPVMAEAPGQPRAPSGKFDWGANRLDPAALEKQIAGDQAEVNLDADILDRELDLNHAVAIAVSRHPSIADTIATLAESTSAIDVARAGYFPQITAGLGGGNSTLTGTGNTTSVSVSQMLFDFGKVSGAVDQAKAGVSRQQATVLKQIDTIAQQTAGAVINAHRYQVLEQIAKEQVTAVEKVLLMSQRRADAGVSTRSDPIQAESRVQSAQADLLQVSAQKAQAFEHLRTLLGGRFAGTIASLPEDKAALVALNPDPNTDGIPDVLAAKADMESAIAQLDVAKAQRWPTLTLDISQNKSLSGVNPSTYVPDGSYRSIMLDVSWKVFQGGALSAQIKAADNALASARSRVQVARLNGSDDARSFRELAIGAKGRFGVLERRKRSITEARNLYREQYKLGTRSILDLLNAEQEFFQAVSDEESVKHDFWINLVGYVAATGAGREFYGLNKTVVQGMDVLP
ncbi:adhesin transport system outer membrane protein [Paraburkholderia sp. RAU2J]|uniref:TolC family outer membrane protein n=1 Tax=Paraburkholderia sp. RAU2J TaxID=1938810 RepID=UPI000F1221F1|nr:TolC family outer membrane protein [Paraburkholderia sp. RAU2J]RKT26528.1 adhesin transport system outer membrane protein [Paraburkholderia sp. RAU2J]